MCFSSPKPPDQQPIPVAAPTPTITPSEISPQAAGEARRKQLEQLQYGLASTIKTSPLGITGTGSDLASTGQGKKSLGS